jgi:hypothetical protein
MMIDQVVFVYTKDQQISAVKGRLYEKRGSGDGIMDTYTWGADGYGRQTICLRDTSAQSVGILCVLPGCSVWDCIDELSIAYCRY